MAHTIGVLQLPVTPIGFCVRYCFSARIGRDFDIIAFSPARVSAVYRESVISHSQLVLRDRLAEIMGGY